jgi:hypothetical protein
MRIKNGGSNWLPRLIVERSGASPDRQIGFLLVSNGGKKIEIGDIDSREFRLIQCLFSPQNFLSAKYEPVTQTYERLFGAIRVSTDTLNERLANHQSRDNEMSLIVEKSLQNLREGGAGLLFAFISEEGRARMRSLAI